MTDQQDTQRRVTAENMALLCLKDLKLDLTPVRLPATSTDEPPLITESTFLKPVAEEDAVDEDNIRQTSFVMTPEPCIPLDGKPMVDNVDFFWGSTLSPTAPAVDKTLTAEEQLWLAKYSCLTREQLAEFREAFLMFAVPPPKSGSNEPRLHPFDVGQCLRAVGQNPTEADIKRILSRISSVKLDVGELLSAGRRSLAERRFSQTLQSRRASSLPAGRRRASSFMRRRTSSIGRRTSSVGRASAVGLQKTRRSSAKTDDLKRLNSVLEWKRSESTAVPTSSLISLEDYLRTINAYGKQRSESDQVKDLVTAFKVFDDQETGFISAARLRSALTSKSERLDDDDAEELFRLVDDQTGEDGQFNYMELVRRLTSV